MSDHSKVSPLAPKSFPEIPPVEGVRFATGAAGIRYKGRTDVMIALLDKGTEVAGVFTKSKCASAPVDWCRARLGHGKARALVVNSGNANAFTGKTGAKAVKRTAELAAAAAGVRTNDIFIASTGVIGEPLDAEKFGGVFETLVSEAAPDGLFGAAKAIMTTDTFPKVATAKATIGGVEVTIAGMAKGAGMIAPDMATMLSFIFTDAPIAAEALQKLLDKGVEPRIEKTNDRRLKEFREALDNVLRDLAFQVVRDGEGARKFVSIKVEGATSGKSAKVIARSIANSPLVKTAIAGEDANWGRVVMAVGKAGEPAERDLLAIWFGDIRVAHKGLRDPAYDEEKVAALMRLPEIAVRVDLGIGNGEATVYTCDLTKEYVEINGDYRS
jgi:glutamate N-acetyltransferase / amino-acid N-acetyltransferase